MMKRLIASGLLLLLVTVATQLPSQAQTRTSSRLTSNTRAPNSFQATPFQLVYLAYRGRFRSQGIPSYDVFLSAYQHGRISVKDIVVAGIQTNRVPAQIMTDKRYLSAVKSYLDSLLAQRS